MYLRAQLLDRFCFLSKLTTYYLAIGPKTLFYLLITSPFQNPPNHFSNTLNGSNYPNVNVLEYLIAGIGNWHECESIFMDLIILTDCYIYTLQCFFLYIHSNMNNYEFYHHAYTTRNWKLIILNFHRLSGTRNSTAFCTINFFNVLHKDARNLSSTKFKQCVKMLFR